ncbi:PREDICTED: uncharacterized protein LOC108367993 isoform X5 [Rhagoletis zephyria]|uniref:uncharacterized protein LOC108367993 isoform X5 n=1 Tax=Rhagoletis zephyria TaxID=28612 RepID=UPI000811507E|nr:PREDICTED: uncharacterized protein LOC108367993 isoform X5 [Rhagoletis zephyria]
MTCRLCLDKPAEVMEIFDENGGLVEGGAIEIIEKYFQIQIQFRDEISNKICLVCWRYLKEFHKFWLNIKEKQRILQIALDCTRIQGKATEDDSYAQKNSTIDRKNDIFSEPELNIVDIKNEPNLAEEFDDDCMNEDSPLLSPQASDEMLSRIIYDAVHEPIPESSTSFVQNDILKTLRETNTQLVKVEENQSILSQGMDTLVGNQERITIAFEEIDKNPQTMALAKGIRECKVADSKMDEVANMIPLHTITAVLEVEQRLQSPDFVRTMTMCLHKVKGASEDVGKVIRRMFTDDLLYKYNWKGTGEKQPLCQLTFVNKTLRDVFSTHDSLEFEKSVRKAVVRAHRRLWQQKYLQKGKTTTTAATTTTRTATSTSTSSSNASCK